MKKINKITLFIMLLAAASVLMQSCGKDNLSYPSSTLSGRFLYNGQPVGLLQTSPDINSINNTGNALYLTQIKGAQPQYSVGEIQLYARHDGSFTGKMFDGDYTVRTLTSKNPFEDFTGTPLTVKGDTKFDIQVVPYFWMTNLKTTFVGNVFTATFNLAKVSTNSARTLQYVQVAVSPTNFADAAAYSAIRTYAPGAAAPNVVVANGTCTVKLDLSTLTTAEKSALAAQGSGGHIWVSVAVKTNGITDALYSDAIPLQ